MRPEYSIKIDGSELKPGIKSRVSSISIVDEVGFISDQVMIDLEDSEGDLAIPKSGASLSVAVGYDGELRSLGNFVVDEVGLDDGGMTINGKGFDTDKGLKTIKIKKYDTKNLGQIVSDIAKGNKLEALVNDSFRTIELERELLQQNESDLHLLNRLAKTYDGILKIQGDKLLFSKKGTGKTVSGRDMKEMVINRAEVSSWSMNIAGRSEYRKVICEVVDVDKGIREKIEVGERPPILRIQAPFNDKNKAINEAKTRLKGSGYQSKSLSITIEGNPQLRSETVVDVRGFRKGIDGKWIVLRSTHNLGSGYTTTLELQKENKE